MPASDPLIGRELGDFVPVRLLGKGGMGAVYEADDLALRRKVALKLLLPEFAEDKTARSRFQREIDHAVAIEHPHVVPVYSAGYEPPYFYIAMRRVPGPDLGEILRNGGPLDELRVLRILGQVASALSAVHAKGLVHRDIKPQNVLLWDAGTNDEHAMLTDFGIAKAVDDTRTLTGVSPIGTPAYMAPEICLGRSPTPACDQYSLGCMAFALLSGSPPFDGDAASLRLAHVEQTPPSLASVAPEVSARVVEAIDKSLQKDPEQRHRNVRDLITVADASDQAFHRSEELSRVITQQPGDAEKVAVLSTDHGFSDEAISKVTALDRTEVVRLRRKHARSALVGRRGGSR